MVNQTIYSGEYMQYDSSYGSIQRYDNDNGGQSGIFYPSSNGWFCKKSDITARRDRSDYSWMG